MKRILALILTVVLLALALTSCAFDYGKKSTAYAKSVDKDAFLAGLQAIALTEQDYDDETKRDGLALDEAYKALLGKANSDTKASSGVASAPDKIFYCYYATDAEGHKFFTSKMATGSAKSFQLGLSNNDEFDNLVASTIPADFEYSFGYRTSGTGEIPGDKTVSVSYTWEKITPAQGETPSTTETIVVTNDLVKLGDGSDNAAIAALYEALIGKNVGSIISNSDTDTNVYKVDDNNTFKYAKVNYIIDQAEKFDITFDVNKDTAVASEKISDVNGEQFDKGELTYHVYPVNYIDVEPLTAESVVSVLYSSIEPTTLKVFADDAGNATDLFTKADAYVVEKKAYDAQAADAKDSTKLTEAKNALLAADDDGNGGSKIVTAYLDSKKDTLLSNYVSGIEKEVYKAVWAKIKEIAVENVPEKAVKKTYKAMLDRYEYSFYEGSYSSDGTTSESNYTHFNKSFEEYLKDATGTSTYADAKAAVREEAVEEVKSTIRVYAIADAFGAKLTKADYTKKDGEYKLAADQLASYEMYAAYGLPTFTEEAKLAAMQFDKVMKVITEHETNDGVITWKLLGTKHADAE